MRYSTTLSMLSGIAALSSFAMAHPQLVKRVDSPDNSCGMVGGIVYTCTSANTGTCCSQYGFCGSTADYCGTGCQDAFGVSFFIFYFTPSFFRYFLFSKEMVEILAEFENEWLTLDVFRRVVRPAAAVVLTRIYAVLRTGAIVA